jgi:hypothetical protein
MKIANSIKIAKGTLKSHHVCVICDSKYVTKGVKYYNSGSLWGVDGKMTLVSVKSTPFRET